VTNDRSEPRAIAARAAAGEGLSRGVVLKLFGVILLALGALDSLLLWRGGLVADDFSFVLLVAGAFVYATGAVRSASRTQQPVQRPPKP